MTAPAFLTPLELRAIFEWESYRQRFVLTAPFVYQSVALKRTVVVPTGFLCDGESLPLLAGAFTGRQCLHAGVLHDWLVQSHQATEEEAAAVYREALWLMGLEREWADQRRDAVLLYGHGAYVTGPARRRVVDIGTLPLMPPPRSPEPEPEAEERVEAG